jgi:hypothetical protein
MSSDSSLRRRAETRKAAGSERRAAIRHPWRRPCIVRPADAHGDGNWSGITSDLSIFGVGVALTYPILPGKTLIIEPLGNYRLRTLRARIVRCVQREFVWFHGCEFMNPLTDEELSSWLG